MRWISPRAVLFHSHKAFDPVNPAISLEMRQSATGVRFAGRTLNFPTAKRRIFAEFKMGEIPVETNERDDRMTPGILASEDAFRQRQAFETLSFFNKHFTISRWGGHMLGLSTTNI